MSAVPAKQKYRCQACMSTLMNMVLDIKTSHVDVYCANCGNFVGHFDIMNSERISLMNIGREEMERRVLEASKVTKLPDELEAEE